MNKKRIVISTIVIIITIIIVLWITGIIPLQIAKVSATNYVESNYPKMNLKFANVEWSNVHGEYLVQFKDKNNKITSFLMPNKYFPVIPGQGSYPLMEKYRVEYETGIKDMNDIYNHSITDGYKAINSLPENYTIKQAREDNCFVSTITTAELNTEFMDKYNKKENAFIRIAMPTIEGDTIIVDVLYEALNDKFHLVADYTRDKECSIRRIDYKTYEKTIVLDNRWYVYNGELPEIIGKNNDNIYSIAIVN